MVLWTWEGASPGKGCSLSFHLSIKRNIRIMLLQIGVLRDVIDWMTSFNFSQRLISLSALILMVSLQQSIQNTGQLDEPQIKQTLPPLLPSHLSHPSPCHKWHYSLQSHAQALGEPHMAQWEQPCWFSVVTSPPRDFHVGKEQISSLSFRCTLSWPQ